MEEAKLGYTPRQNTTSWREWTSSENNAQWGLVHLGVVLCIFNDKDEARYQLRLMKHQLHMDEDDPALCLEEYISGYYRTGAMH